MIERESELIELAMELGWQSSEAKQFCCDNKEEQLRMKFFLLVKKWTTKLGDAATIGKLIGALDDIEKGGVATKILRSRFQ